MNIGRSKPSSVRLPSFAPTQGLVGAAAMALLVGCLPSDDRPLPGRLHVVVEPSRAVTEGLSTADGWRVSFDEVLVQMTSAFYSSSPKSFLGASDEACTIYSEAPYSRLVSITAPGRQKVADLYALGSCDVEVFLAPALDMALGAGVTDTDVAMMRTPGPDVFTTQWFNLPEGEDWFRENPSVYVHGRASRGATTKAFEWKFSVLGQTFAACSLPLPSDAMVELPVVVHAEAIFGKVGGSSTAPEFNFDAMANADLDGDQWITMAELRVAWVDYVEPGTGHPTHASAASTIDWALASFLFGVSPCSSPPAGN